MLIPDKMLVTPPGGGGGLGVISFRADGYYRIAVGIDPYVVRDTLTISEVVLHRSVAGTSSSTIIDVHKNGTTIFTTQANRPEIAFGGGDDQTVVKTPDVISLISGDILTVDIDQVEGGNPQGFIVEVKV